MRRRSAGGDVSGEMKGPKRRVKLVFADLAEFSSLLSRSEGMLSSSF